MGVKHRGQARDYFINLGENDFNMIRDVEIGIRKNEQLRRKKLHCVLINWW
jgi:hypothetical protein